MVRQEYRPQRARGLDESQGCYAFTRARRVRMRTTTQAGAKFKLTDLGGTSAGPRRQSCAWAGCGAMATAFGCAESPAPGEPATPRERTRLRCATAQTAFASQKRTPGSMRARQRALVAVLGRGLTRRRRLGFIRATARPCAALQPPRGTPPVARHACHLQRRARPGRGANEAQAPAVDGLAAQRRSRAPQGAKRATRTSLTRKACLNRNEVKVSCFARAA